MVNDKVNGCECVWTSDNAMRLLLNFMRQQQDHCSDTQCIDVPSLVAPQRNYMDTSMIRNDGYDRFLMMSIVMIFTGIICFIRLLGYSPYMTKAKRNQQYRDNNDDAQPPPPPAIN